MNMKISPAVAVIIVIIVVGIVVAFGYKTVTGGKDADVTQQVIDHYKQAAQNTPAPAAGSNSGAGNVPSPTSAADASGGKRYH